MVMRELKISERRACKTIGQIRSTQRYVVFQSLEQEQLEARIIAVASEFGRYGYRQFTDMQKLEGFSVGKDQPGSPWENGYCDSFNGKMRYELLDGEIFYSLLEAKIVIERWRIHYNTKKPQSSSHVFDLFEKFVFLG